MEKVRLQKYLASKGVASRRKSEEYIANGLVKVNGEVVTVPGVKVDPDTDKVEVNNEAISEEKAKYVYIMLNKPRGYITSLKQDDSSSPLVVDLVKGFGRIYPVGRLDKDSSGLLLLTNDGDFAYKLTHPSFEKEKEYIVSANERISSVGIDKFKKGVKIDGVMTAPAKVRRIDDFTISMTIIEGRNRQIRKMMQKVGNSVKTLHRIRVKNLLLGNLKNGSFRELTAEEVLKLKNEK